MIFRPADRRRPPDAHRLDEVLAAADRHFGRHPDAADPDGVVTIDGIRFVHDAGANPPFALQPECDRCGTQDLDQFPLEGWTMFGAEVRAQARTACRDCRFLDLAGRPASLA